MKKPKMHLYLYFYLSKQCVYFCHLHFFLRSHVLLLYFSHSCSCCVLLPIKKRTTQANKSLTTLRVCMMTKCWQEARKLSPLEKWHRPNKDAILPSGRLVSADSLSGRPWDWDKYCSVIESHRLFPVGREKRRRQNIQPWTWTSHKDMYGLLTAHALPLKKKHICNKISSSLQPGPKDALSS